MPLALVEDLFGAAPAAVSPLAIVVVSEAAPDQSSPACHEDVLCMLVEFRMNHTPVV